MNLKDIAGDIMERYEDKYHQIRINLRQDLEKAEKYNDDIKAEKRQAAYNKAMERAEALKADYIDKLKKRVDSKENEFKRQQETRLRQEKELNVERKTFNAMQQLLTQQIINGGNEQQIKDHLLDNLENRKIAEMMSYHYADKEGADEIRNKINDALTEPIDHIDSLRGRVNHMDAMGEVINFGDVDHNFENDIRGNSAADHYFG